MEVRVLGGRHRGSEQVFVRRLERLWLYIPTEEPLSKVIAVIPEAKVTTMEVCEVVT